MVWCRFLLILWLIVFARSEVQSENHEGPTSTASAFCSAECNQQIQNRLETIESAVRTIVSALLSTKNDVLSSVREILLQDPSITSMVPALNSTIFSSTVRSENSSFFENAAGSPGIPGKQVLGGHQPENSKAVENLKGVVKCSLIAYLDVDMIDFNSYVNQSTHVTASLANESLEIKWPLYSAACLKFSSGVWIRVYQQAPEGDYNLQPETSLYVPQKCIKKNFETSYSIVLLPSSSNEKNNSCAFSLARNLIQCRVYVIEVIPNFQSLRGSKTLRTEIVVPPKDGIVEDEGTNMTVTIPRICLKQSPNEDNLFSLVLPNNNKPTSCPIEWKPLDRCRKYRLDMVSIYSVIWSGPSSSSDIFTVQQEGHVNTCVQLTNPSGNFISRPFPKPAVDIHRERLPDAVRKSSIYDGPFSTSPLLFSHSGSVKPSYSVRSSSNDLFVEFPSYYDTNMGIEAFYASVKKINGTDKPFVPDINTAVQKPLGRNYRDYNESKLPDALSSSDGLSLDHHRETGIKSPVFDGPTVYSEVLLAKSGSVSAPFIVNASSNQMLVRFTSDGDTSFPGFIAVYISV
ncbi:hypothetical protein DAPPUDRAFT_110979 [Daphnia pulex]|uniref:CUB domain-containing protein n=1 Tax=Daphnia pulex TaxID=6669 RepID=E9H7S5_DAPPU|nr:hypothetical protein DAPPUDRAFT_110979 [Daphnia pulex]|eukprot:EFX72251.1 hypothetical protein DAPPUDRAFT_110979 [Daphnia pulex]